MQVKQFGVKKVFALIQDPDYLNLLDGHDITAISTPDASAVMVENLLERPGVAELFKLGEGQGNLSGICVATGSSVIGKKIHDIEFPEDCIIAALIREGKFIVPRGGTEIHENDHVLFIGINSAIHSACKIFSAKG